jgi:hypothetical protein
MSNCENELNSHLKAIHARLDRVDSDLRSHFAAQFLQSVSFLANPLTAAQGAVMAAQFASREAFNKLADQIPGVEEFKKLQHLDAAALVDSLETYLANTAVGMVDTAVQKLENAVDAKIAAYRNYILAVEENAIDSVVGPLLDAYNQATAALNKANSALGALKNFLKTLGDISSCKTESSVIRA